MYLKYTHSSAPQVYHLTAGTQDAPVSLCKGHGIHPFYNEVFPQLPPGARICSACLHRLGRLNEAANAAMSERRPDKS